MSFKRQLLLSFGLQGGGAAAVLLATLLLGTNAGPEVQGRFSHTKSELEFVAALAMFGLPQALFFHVKAGLLSGEIAIRWALRTALLSVPIAIAYALAQHGVAAAALMVLAVAACVAHGQFRALLLVQDRTEWFNVLTALPQILVLVGIVCGLGFGLAHIASASTDSAWFALFTAAYAAAAVAAWGRLRPMTRQRGGSAVKWWEVGRYGLALWSATALSTAAVVTMQFWVERADGLVALGCFTMAMTLAQVPLTPVSYAAPLLFRRWMELPGGQASRRWAGRLFVGLTGVACLVWIVGSRWPDLGLGASYTGATRALGVLLAGAAAEAASRVLTAQASASGFPWVAARAEVARWTLFAVAWLLPLPRDLLALCAVWAAGSGAAALVFVAHAYREARFAREAA